MPTGTCPVGRGSTSDSLLFDGQPVPVIGGTPRCDGGTTLLIGHPVEQPNQVVFGRASLLALGKQVGDTVRVSGGGHSETLTIVGEASLPAVGIGFGLHLSIGTGAVVDYHLIPAGARNIQGAPTTGPNAVFVRFNKQVSPTAGARSVQRVANAIDATTGGAAGIQDYRVLLPAEIINYKTMGSIPRLLGRGSWRSARSWRSGSRLAGIGPAAAAGPRAVEGTRLHPPPTGPSTVGHSKRRVTSALGTLIGVPLGIFAGKWLWDLFAHELDVVPVPTVPVLAVVCVALGLLDPRQPDRRLPRTLGGPHPGQSGAAGRAEQRHAKRPLLPGLCVLTT